MKVADYKIAALIIARVTGDYGEARYIVIGDSHGVVFVGSEVTLKGS
jgi:uncharacterized DUF497 family protein